MKKLTIAFLSAVCALCTTSFAKAEPKNAKEAWEGLVAENLRKFPVFEYIENEPKLPNVLIYGDSISIGYTAFVRKELATKANVYRIHCNGAHAAAFIPRMRQLEQAMRSEELSDPWAFEWDVIHLNAGLHDLKYVNEDKKLDKKNGKLVSTPEKYKEDLTRVFKFLTKEYPDAKIIFATTTPVPEGEPGRNAGDAVQYNAIAKEVLKEYPNVVVNDLYAFTKPKMTKWQIKPGDVHFKAEGKRKQGAQVGKAIAAQLPAN